MRRLAEVPPTTIAVSKTVHDHVAICSNDELQAYLSNGTPYVNQLGELVDGNYQHVVAAAVRLKLQYIQVYLNGS